MPRLTEACTRPATRWLSCTFRDVGGRVMPGVRRIPTEDNVGETLEGGTQMRYGSYGNGKFLTEIVLCPCGPKCRGYNSDPEPEERNRCYFDYETENYPEHLVGRDLSFTEKSALALYWLKGRPMFVIYVCPHCRCEVLFVYHDRKPSLVEEMIGSLIPRPRLIRVSQRSRC